MLDLRLVGSEYAYFHETYRWLDRATFVFDDLGDNSTTLPMRVLSKLICDRHYVDAYQDAVETARNVDSRDKINLSYSYHGPYHYSFISVESFEPITGSVARETLRRWLLDEPALRRPTADQVATLRRAVEYADELIAELNVFRLRDLGADSMHESGPPLDAPFLELVVVDAVKRTVQLVVGGGD